MSTKKYLKARIIELSDSEINIMLSSTRLKIPNIQYRLRNSIGFKHRKQYYNIIIILTLYYPSMFMQIIPIVHRITLEYTYTL